MKRLFILLPVWAVIFVCCIPRAKRHDRSGGILPDSIAEVVALPGDTPRERALRDAGFVGIDELIPAIIVDLAYAKADNFTGQVLYHDLSKAFLADTAARSLLRALEILQHDHSGYTFIVYDAARPVSVQAIMKECVRGTSKSGYVGAPGNSLHNYGAAVDLTVADPDCNPLDMGTEFDDLSPLSRIDNENSGQLTPGQLENRRILRHAMTAAGFRTIPGEWWHFQICSLGYAATNLPRVE